MRAAGRLVIMTASLHATTMTARPRFETIEAYVAAADPEVRASLRQMRDLVLAAVPDAVPCISYQLPAFRRGRVFCYFAAFQRHLGVYPPVHDPVLVRELEPYRGPKGNLKFPWREPLPWPLLRRVVLALAKQYAGAPERS